MKVSQALSVRGGVMALLALYLAAFISSPAGVPHLHHDISVLHDDSCRKDPCHVAVYHPGDKHHCHHKHHLSATGEECDLCKISVVIQDVTRILSLPPLGGEPQEPCMTITTQRVIYVVSQLSNKGPPAIS